MITKDDLLLNTLIQHDVKEIVITDKSEIPVKFCGDVKITTMIRDTKYTIPVTGVLFVPSLATNLLSISHLMSK